MQIGGCRAGRSRLLPGQAEIADEDRIRRVGEVVHLGHAPHAPAFEPGDEVGDAAVALPPVLVSALQALDDRGEQARLRRVGHVPDFVRGVAEGAKEVHLALVALGQLAAVAHADHLCPARLRQSRLAGNVSEVAGFLGIGHIEDRSAVVLLFPGKGIQQIVAVMPDIGDPTAALFVDDGLIGAAALEIVVTDELHVALLGLVLRRHGLREQGSEYRNPSGAFRAKARHAFLLG